MKRSRLIVARGRRLELVLPLLGILALGFSRAAPACTTDAECDNGDTCSVPDQCQAGACVAGGAGDADADLICDDEFDPAANLTITKVIVRTTSHPEPVPAPTIIRGNGDFIDTAATGPFSTADGIAVRVKDHLSGVPPTGDGADITMTFGAADCSPIGAGVRCRIESGPTTGSFVKFIPNTLAPEQIRVSYRFKGLVLTKPFFGPVRVIVTHDTVTHRLGQITDCRLFASGIKCREF